MEIQSLKRSHLSLLSIGVAAEQRQLRVEIDALKAELYKKEQQYQDNEKLLSELGYGAAVENLSKGQQFVESTTIISELDSQYPNIENGHKYKSDWSYWQKIQFILHRTEKPITAREIIDGFFSLEPDLDRNDLKLVKKVENNLFATLTHKVETGTLQRFRDAKEFKYGFTDWFDTNGNLKKKYMQ